MSLTIPQRIERVWMQSLTGAERDAADEAHRAYLATLDWPNLPSAANALARALLRLREIEANHGLEEQA